MAHTCISVAHVTKSYGSYTAVEDVSFDISQGDMVALVGPNGSGKSTLARMIVGLESPSSGSILIDGKSPHDMSQHIGYVPQRFSFDRSLPMTVMEFLSLADPSRKTIERSLTRVQMYEKREAQLGTLSGGQLQRVLIARALLHTRDMLILDEPTSGIDVGGEEALYELLHTLNHEDGTTIIVISHELDFVYQYATTVICLNKQLLCKGLPRTALSSDMLEKMYGGHVRHYAHDCDHRHEDTKT